MLVPILQCLYILATVAIATASFCFYPGHGIHSSTNMTTRTVPKGTVVTYQCDKGFELFKSERRMCLEDGTWSGIQAICATNVARHRQVVRISSAIDQGNSETSQLILDGYYSTCSIAYNTNKVPSQWTIDLLQFQDVIYVQVVFGEPLQDVVFEVYAGDKPDSKQALPIVINDGQPFMHPVFVDFELGVRETSAYDLWLEKPVNARFVTVRVAPYVKRKQISLCEVSVYSTTAATSEQCQQPWLDEIPVAVTETTCFSFHRDSRLKWSEARMRCAAANGSLVSGVTATSQEFLRTSLRSQFSPPSSKDIFWVGGHKRKGFEDEDVTPIMQWLNDTTQKYFVWKQPGSGITDALDSCLTISGPLNWMWTIENCHMNYPFICQFGLPSCGSPDQLNITSLKLEGQHLGDMAEYSCPEGHVLVGPPTRYCLKTGKWSEHTPWCQFVRCGFPEEIENGTVILLQGGTTYGSAAEYACDTEGQEPIGVKTRVCERNGQWSGEIPVCGEAIPQPAEPYTAILSLEVLGIAMACLALMVLVTAITFLIVCMKNKSKARRRHHVALARFDSEDFMIDAEIKSSKNGKKKSAKNGTKNGTVLLAYGNGTSNAKV